MALYIDAPNEAERINGRLPSSLFQFWDTVGNTDSQLPFLRPLEARTPKLVTNQPLPGSSATVWNSGIPPQPDSGEGAWETPFFKKLLSLIS